MLIRAAKEADLLAIRSLLVETWHATYDPIYGAQRVTQITDDWHSLQSLRARLARADAAFLVAETDGNIAAMAFAAPGEKEQVILYQLYVLPACQGGGLGSQLLSEVETRFDQAIAIVLEVEEANMPARRFYERKGFEMLGRNHENALRYRRELRKDIHA